MVAFCRIDDREIRVREPIIEPDAIIVQTHRDPIKVITSVSALYAQLRRMTTDEIARYCERWSCSTARPPTAELHDATHATLVTECATHAPPYDLEVCLAPRHQSSAPHAAPDGNVGLRTTRGGDSTPAGYVSSSFSSVWLNLSLAPHLPLRQ